MTKNIKRLLALTGLLVAFATESQAQWVQQQFVLRPGWNAVFLEVAPPLDRCDELFAGLPIESVWDWNRTADSAQFVQDPSTLIPGAPGWLTWFPPGHPLASQANLFTMRDGRPYLIKLADNATVTNWTVTGKPSLRRITWQAGGLNFVGFHAATNPAPNFATWFAGEPSLTNQPVYRLNASGAWEGIANLTTMGPKPGEGYWVRCKAPATRTATIDVNPGSRLGLSFGPDAVEQSIRIRNTSAGNRNISVRLLSSAAPPVGQPLLAGAAPLVYRVANYAAAQFDWKPLTNALTFTALTPGAEWNVQLAVRRAGLTTAIPGAEFQSVLEVTDDAGARWLLPVSVKPTVEATSLVSAAAHAGLWIGEAVIKKVSQPAHPGDAQLPRTAGGEFQFRLIVHVDSAGTARLLQHVYLVRKPPTFIADPENPGYEIVDQPARSVAITDEALIPELTGNTEIIGRRASSAAFGFSQPVVLTGGEFGSGTLTNNLVLDYNDPLNPFKHVYHPDHNNLDERFEQTLAEGKEAFTVTRSVRLEFTATDPLGQNPPGWGDTELGGTYRETISGLHRNAIHVNGNFRLVRVLTAAALNE